ARSTGCACHATTRPPSSRAARLEPGRLVRPRAARAVLGDAPLPARLERPRDDDELRIGAVRITDAMTPQQGAELPWPELTRRVEGREHERLVLERKLAEREARAGGAA